MCYKKLLFLIISFIVAPILFCMEEKIKTSDLDYSLKNVKEITHNSTQFDNSKTETYYVSFTDSTTRCLFARFNPLNPTENVVQYYYADSYRLVDLHMLRLIFPTFNPNMYKKDATIQKRMLVHLIKQLNQKYCEQNPNAERYFEKW